MEMNPPPESPPVLVVIPTLNEAQHIESLVDQLMGTAQRLPLRIVLVDGGSTDGTVEKAQALAAEYEQVHFLDNPKQWQSAAVNLAVKTHGADCEYLIRMDAHADYPDDYCRVLLEEARAHQADAVVVPMHTVGNQGFQRAAAAAQNSLLGNGGAAHRNRIKEGKWVDHGHHALMRIEAFQNVGGYDASFSHNEDAELDIRLKQASYGIWLSAQTELTYYPRATMEGLFRQYRHYGRGRARTLIKHRMKPRLRQLLPVGIMPVIALALCFLLTFESLFLWPFFIWMVGCILYSLVEGGRLGDPDIMYGLWLAAMIMHAAWSLGFWETVIREKFVTPHAS